MAPKPSRCEEMRGSFAADDANGLAARREFPAHQLFHGQRVSDVVRERRKIIQPIRVRHELVVVHVLGDFFVAAMQVADVRRGFGDDLAVELEHEAQNAVRRRMRRPHVEDHLFADVAIGMIQLCVRCDYSCHGIRRLNLTRRERHGRSYKVTTLQGKTTIFTLASEPTRARNFGAGGVSMRPLAAP